jgi:hypothetical protein
MAEKMTESWGAAMDRLRREGRFEEASAFRDEVRQRLRDEGATRREASVGAWKEMLEKYRPLAPAAVPIDATAVPSRLEEEPDFDFPEQSCDDIDLAGDIFWVYEHLEDELTEPKDAPGRGAWSLLRWARDHRSKFIEQLLPKAKQAGLRGKNGGGVDDDRDYTDAELEQMLIQMGGVPREPVTACH